MSRLLRPKNISRPSNFQITQRNFKSSPKLRIFLDRLQPLDSHRCYRPVLRQQHICVSSVFKSPHSSAKLMKLRQPKPVCVIYNDRIGIRNINSRFDNRRANQNIDLPKHKFYHRFFKFVFMHLPVRNTNPKFRYQLLNIISEFLDRLHPVMYKKNLSLPVQLKKHRSFDRFFIKFLYMCYNRSPIQRRRCQ